MLIRNKTPNHLILKLIKNNLLRIFIKYSQVKMIKVCAIRLKYFLTLLIRYKKNYCRTTRAKVIQSMLIPYKVP